MAVLMVAGALLAAAQTTYQPKFKGDPARSDSEAAALGYMRTVIRAQQQYHKKNDKYAATLADLVHTGSFTQRMTKTDRGDYTVSFRSRKDGYELSMTPKVLDAEHRSFYASEDAVIHADEGKIADESSPVVK
jgi:type II secretory pathway pseudopilin PulG